MTAGGVLTLSQFCHFTVAAQRGDCWLDALNGHDMTESQSLAVWHFESSNRPGHIGNGRGPFIAVFFGVGKLSHPAGIYDNKYYPAESHRRVNNEVNREKKV
jgi:hypothetical protein